MTPFILMGRKKLPPENSPSCDQVWDEHRQLWIDKMSGEPLVTSMRECAQPTQFGETTITETREGVDRAQVGTLEASRFGETTLSRSREGVDQAEVVSLQASQFGETTMTKTQEGADRPEALGFETFNAAHSHF